MGRAWDLIPCPCCVRAKGPPGDGPQGQRAVKYLLLKRYRQRGPRSAAKDKAVWTAIQPPSEGAAISTPTPVPPVHEMGQLQGVVSDCCFASRGVTIHTETKTILYIKANKTNDAYIEQHVKVNRLFILDTCGANSMLAESYSHYVALSNESIAALVYREGLLRKPDTCPFLSPFAYKFVHLYIIHQSQNVSNFFVFSMISKANIYTAECLCIIVL